MARFAIRVDASRQMGSGHVMRCLTLAGELRRRGGDVLFICREHPGNLCDLIEAQGFASAHLPPAGVITAPANGVAHVAWLRVDWEVDATETIASVQQWQPDWLIVDHYAIDSRWEQRLRPHVGGIMVIDDIADRPHDCDLILDQNLYRDLEQRYETLIPTDCKKLLGPKYALLRPEFTAIRKQVRQRDGHIQRVLIFFGGTDTSNETAKAINAIACMKKRSFTVDVIVGGHNPHKEMIERLCTQHNGFHFHCKIDNMAELMANADLAIGAGGTATWERCAVGLPAIVLTLAMNQVALATYAAQKGLLLYLGEASTITATILTNVLNSLLYAPYTLQFFGDNCLQTVDAKGVARVANSLLPIEITLRRASLQDCEAVYQWRNAESTRQHIFNPETIPYESHKEWFTKTLENPDRILLIGEIGSHPAGVLRYDMDGNEARISVYLVPGNHGHGTGSQLIRCGSEWLRQHHPHIRAINAEIFRENIASLHAFAAAGFKEHHLIFKEVQESQ
jgi:UDP-2,4-diacetamido-2,4,6-trideoxy-beta-L-altropyranose hydrolase